MNVFLVGGAVRDRLLGLPVHEKDWVVVGATPDEMLNRGFRQVGNDFPVFLHPHTHEEYALARVERKTGHGYQGFAFDTSPNVTLEEDLMRRDLTVNAIAEDASGQIVDPYDGQSDLEKRIFRHVSPAFSEDPLRVLRVARFTTRYAPQRFTIDPETMQLMSDIVAAGELPHLAAERIWSETERAMATPQPSIYFQVLRACGALAVLLPEVEALFGVPQPPKWHPEVDTGLHTLMVIDQAAQLSDDLTVRFAGLMHDLGKALTPPEQWPSHRGHEATGAKLVDQVCDRIRAPKQFRKLAKDVAEYHTHCHKVFELKPSTLLKALNAMSAFRDPDHVRRFTLACEADARGRTGLEQRPYPQAAFFCGAMDAALNVKNADIAAQGHTGKAFGDALQKARILAIRDYKATNAPQTNT
ncbi:MAG: multifunctional CCA addition/repair protein [Woeseiaceae bacterium]